MNGRLLPHDYLSRAPIERLICRLWRLGPRAVAEFLNELAIDRDLAAEIERKLEAYASIDSSHLSALGGDRFAPSPMRIAGGAR
jgi:hypothetical protein